jgi:hypothetical protein
MLVAVALLALVLPSWMIAAAPARMILGSSGRRKCDNGEGSKNATKGNHVVSRNWHAALRSFKFTNSR